MLSQNVIHKIKLQSKKSDFVLHPVVDQTDVPPPYLVTAFCVLHLQHILFSCRSKWLRLAILVYEAAFLTASSTSSCSSLIYPFLLSSNIMRMMAAFMTLVALWHSHNMYGLVRRAQRDTITPNALFTSFLRASLAADNNFSFSVVASLMIETKIYQYRYILSPKK